MRAPTAAFLAALLIPALGYAQQSKQEWQSPATASLGLALQQANIAAGMMHEDMQRRNAALQERIADLEKRCGEPCKTHTQEPPK